MDLTTAATKRTIAIARRPGVAVEPGQCHNPVTHRDGGDTGAASV